MTSFLFPGWHFTRPTRLKNSPTSLVLTLCCLSATGSRSHPPGGKRSVWGGLCGSDPPPPTPSILLSSPPSPTGTEIEECERQSEGGNVGKRKDDVPDAAPLLLPLHPPCDGHAAPRVNARFSLLPVFVEGCQSAGVVLPAPHLLLCCHSVCLSEISPLRMYTNLAVTFKHSGGRSLRAKAQASLCARPSGTKHVRAVCRLVLPFWVWFGPRPK